MMNNDRLPIIKHHNYFQVHLPIKNYLDDSEDALGEMIMEEFYLFSNGKMTSNYETPNKKENPLAITLYPSFVYLCEKLEKTDHEKFQFINDCIDNEFVNMLFRFKPVYKVMDFIDYHLSCYTGNPELFYKHIKYVILNLIKRRDNNKELNPQDVESLFNVVQDWVNMRTQNKSESNFATTISDVKNVIINNDSQITNQTNSRVEKSKPKESDKVKYFTAVISLTAVILTIIIYWDKILLFFE